MSDWLYGATVFVVFQCILRLTWLIPLNLWLKDVLTGSTVLFIGFIAFASLTAGLFERGGQWLLFRRFIPHEKRTATTALMVGAGRGGVEALIIGVIIALSGVGYIIVQSLPPEAVKGYEQEIAKVKEVFAQTAWWMPFMGMWERFCSQAAQIGLTINLLRDK